MDQQEFLRELAATLRSRLEALTGADAARIEADLAVVLNAGDDPVGEQQQADLLQVLASNPQLHSVAAAALGRGEAEQVEEVLREIAGAPPGHSDPDYRPTRFACPRRDFVWYRRQVGQAVPECPTHHLAVRPQPLSG